MTALTGTDFIEMRLSKVVAIALEDDDAAEPSFFVVLDGVSADVRLPIMIGATEALHLSATLGGTQFARPMSPQFAAGLLQALGGRLRQVRIDRLLDVRGGTAFGATAEVEGPAGLQLVDARPSDALNLAALCPAPILVAAGVLAGAQAAQDGSEAAAARLRLVLEAEPMIIRPPAGR
jgi:uncharacterized protein